MPIVDDFARTWASLVALAPPGLGDEAQDVAAEAILSCLLRERRGQDTNAAFAREAARYRALDEFRRRRRSFRGLGPPRSLDTLLADGFDLSAPAEPEPDLDGPPEHLLACLSALERREVQLAEQGLSRAEIGAAVGRRPNRVSKDFMRIRAKVSAYLASQPGEAVA